MPTSNSWATWSSRISRLDRFAGIVSIRPSRMKVLSTASRGGGIAMSFRLPEHAV
jgi:hypothetical protein